MSALVRKSRVVRSTGAKVELIDADHPDCSDFQSEEGGRWVIVCATHNGFVQHDVYRDARKFLAHPEDWCEGCQGVESVDGEEGFSEEERKRGLETRRRKAAEKQKLEEEEASRKAAVRDLEEQWTLWIAGCPVLEPAFTEAEEAEAAELRVTRATAGMLAKQAKRTRGDLERELADLPEKPKKKEGKEERADLEKRIADLDAQEVEQQDKARLADLALSRVSRIAYLRACLERHWRLTKPGAYGRYLARTGSVDLRIPDNYLDGEGYSLVGKPL